MTTPLDKACARPPAQAIEDIVKIEWEAEDTKDYPRAGGPLTVLSNGEDKRCVATSPIVNATSIPDGIDAGLARSHRQASTATRTSRTPAVAYRVGCRREVLPRGTTRVARKPRGDSGGYILQQVTPLCVISSPSTPRHVANRTTAELIGKQGRTRLTHGAKVFQDSMPTDTEAQEARRPRSKIQTQPEPAGVL